MTQENELTLEVLQEALSKEIEKREALETKVESLAQPSYDSSADKTLIEQLQNQVAQYEQENVELRQSTAERFVSAFEDERVDLDPEEDIYAQRIFDAIKAKGFEVVPIEQSSEEETKEELEEPDVIAGKREGYEYLPAFNISIKK